MRSRWIVLACVGLFGGAASCGGGENSPASDGSAGSTPEVTGETAARVNGETISVDDVMKIAKNFARQGLNSDPAARGSTDQEKLYYTVVDRLVEQRLVLQEAKKKGLSVTDDEVALGLEQIKSAAGGEAAFQQTMTEVGITLAEVERDIRANLITRAFYDQLAIAQVSDEDVTRFYEENQSRYGPQAEVNARHILIRTQPQMDDMAKAETRRRAQAALDRARDGEDFAGLAKELSEDEITGPNEGDLGWFGRQRMVPSFDAAAFALEKGEISDLVETQFGYHIILLVGHRTQEGRSLDEVRETIRSLLEQQNAQSLFKTTVDNMVAGAQVEIQPPSENTLAELGS